ncbi:hypothetical protein [Mycoplana rhizolycopersici]|uniref:Uncharacterized protein n=1 Tax=Mycoplana rhizolycopersici TaxID=2746702 RepID=A0ABX2QJD7_9HYPH|nr:hypothetical protein [Rhizobium rhizolycopersici]NVP57890.1 hypothetical protein [Rhizobium rhizolycopersici]
MNRAVHSPAQRRMEAIRTRAARASRDVTIVASAGEIRVLSGEFDLLKIPADAPVDDRDFYLHLAEDHFWLLDKYSSLARLHQSALSEITRLSSKHQAPNFAAECAMKCKDDHLFRKFLHKCHGADASDLDRIKTRARSILVVQSMAELNTDENARQRWLSLRAEFDRWRKRK